MVNGPLRTSRSAKREGWSAAAIARDYEASPDASNFMKICRLFATNTGKIANPAFKALC
jgi:hypothetical protein